MVDSVKQYTYFTKFQNVTRFYGTSINVILYAPSLHCFSPNSQMLNRIKCKSLILDHIQMRKYIWKVLTEIHLWP